MSFTIKDYMIEELGLGGNELLIYGFLSSHHPCDMSVKEIGDGIGVSLARARGYLKSLEKQGLITKVAQAGSNYIYFVHEIPTTSPSKVSEVDTTPLEEEPIRRERNGGSDKFNPRREIFKRNGRELE